MEWAIYYDVKYIAEEVVLGLLEDLQRMFSKFVEAY